MNDIYVSDGSDFSYNYVKSTVKQKLKDIFIQEWNYCKSSQDHCNSYNTFKKDWCLEKYLTELNYYQRKNLAKFRCRSNNLPVNNIRYLHILEDDSEIYCKLCRKFEIGDEFHYLFNCSFFDEERKKYIPEEILQDPNESSLDKLFASENINSLINLANFVDLIMKIYEHQNEWDREEF